MSDKMREDFSKHCHLWRYSEEVDENGFFTNPTTQRAWDVWTAAWQASRAAVVVELPSVYIVDDAYIDADSRDPNDSYLSEDDVKQSITAAGVSYK